MSGTVYALLVGINDYGGKPSPLRGCRADVEALAAVLEGRVAPGALQLETLLDQDATRQRIIDGFQSHLGRAGPGDVALFAFSGHGSFEPVDERLWFLEPTGQNQTIVCADSRNKRAGDLADKELNELIAGVAEKGPHVVVVLDCCHSGGGTRDPKAVPNDVGVRLAPPADEARPVERYLPGVREAAEAAAAGRPVGDVRHARHVALSACEPDQLSKEVPVGGGSRGAFSAALERALTTMPASASYRDLVRAAANEVRNRVSDQDPTVFAEGEAVDQAFLGGAIQAAPGGDHAGARPWSLGHRRRQRPWHPVAARRRDDGARGDRDGGRLAGRTPRSDPCRDGRADAVRRRGRGRVRPRRRQPVSRRGDVRADPAGDGRGPRRRAGSRPRAVAPRRLGARSRGAGREARRRRAALHGAVHPRGARRRSGRRDGADHPGAG